MSLKAKVEAIIYAAEEPVTLEQISVLLREAVLAELASARENAAIEQRDSVDSLDEYCESEALPELESAEEEKGELEPGPLMPSEFAENVQESASFMGTSFSADDEPLFAMQSEAGAATGEGTEALDAATSAASSASIAAPDATARKRQPKKSDEEIADDKAVRTRLREVLGELVADYASEERGMEIRQIAGGFRMATKPQHHDVVRAFAKSLKPPIRLSLAALETLAVIAYKQPVTAPEIADIRGVESASVLGTLLDRKLITTAGRKQVIGRPMQYKTSKDFLLRFGLNDVNELPSMEEFSQLASDSIEIAPGDSQTASLFEPGAESTGSSEPQEAPSAEGSTSVAQDSVAQERGADEEQASQETEPGKSPEAGEAPEAGETLEG